MINISTFQTSKTIRDAAISQGDEKMLGVLDGVNDDLIAAEAKYHKACHSSCVSKSNLRFIDFNEGKKEDSYKTAFLDLVTEITPELRYEKAFDMSILLVRYQAYLKQKGVLTAQSYTSQKLKLLMKKHFENDIVCH